VVAHRCAASAAEEIEQARLHPFPLLLLRVSGGPKLWALFANHAHRACNAFITRSVFLKADLQGFCRDRSGQFAALAILEIGLFFAESTG
jgi:hypothetical protein